MDTVLLGFALKRAAADGLEDDDAKKRARVWLDFWLNQFAIVHARFPARCVLNRAAACVDAVNAPCARASLVDVTSDAAAATAGQRQRRRFGACPPRDPILCKSPPGNLTTTVNAKE